LYAPTIIDERSNFNPHHIGVVMEKAGFDLIREAKDGPFDEWIGYYKRVR
jgi:hypothetical protein